MTKVVLATRNHHKVEELREILADVCDELGLDIVGLDEFPDAPDVVEDGVTFAENAMLKARRGGRRPASRRSRTTPGSPSTCSAAPPASSAPAGPAARADRANLELLLAQLGDVRDEHRAAAFVCAAALVLPDGRSAAEVGALPGQRRPRAPGERRLRLRPHLRPRRPAGRRGTHPGGVCRRGEERRLAPVPRLPRAGPHLKELLRP